MLDRRWLTACLALSVLARCVHCLYTDANLCARVLSPHPVQPLSNPADYDPNESGCVCKGAIRAPSCELSDTQLSPALHLVVAAVPDTLVCPMIGNATARDLWLPPPVSAHAMRALISSWQI